MGARQGRLAALSFNRHQPALPVQTGKPVGECVLYFGCRRRDQDFLYGPLLEGWAAEGHLQLHTAFSRQQVGGRCGGQGPKVEGCTAGQHPMVESRTSGGIDGYPRRISPACFGPTSCACVSMLTAPRAEQRPG